MQGNHQLETVKNVPLGQKLLLIFWEPKATFQSLKERSYWLDIVIPLILILTMTITATHLISSITTQDFRSMITKSERLSDEQKAKAMERFERQQTSVFKYVGGAITVLLKIVVVAGVLIVINNFIFAGEIRFIQSLAAVAYINLIDLIGWAVRLPLIFAQETSRIYTGPALFVEETKSYWFNFLAGLDIFAFWKVVLLAISVSVFTRKSFKSAFTVWMSVWLIFGAAMAALSGLIRI
jgi:hypothetical protein